MSSTAWLNGADDVVNRLLLQLGKTLVVALPLGLGKPVPLVNALYQRAKNDPSINLTFLTALSLERPPPGDSLQSRFLEPTLQRIYHGCPSLAYMHDLREQTVPANITIKEFFFQPGSRLGNAHAQYHYISSNYTHAARDVFENGCNVVLQMVASREIDGRRKLSMSCNPDTSAELVERLTASRREFRSVAVLNRELPYMCGDAEVDPDFYDMVLEAPTLDHPLFSAPKLQPLGDVDYLLGLHASCLVADGGTLQIGIGALGDAVTYALCLRQQNNAVYKEALLRTGILTPERRDFIKRVGGTGPFERGLYGATEMLVEGFMHLQQAGILKREVYDFWALQQLINAGDCDPERLDSSVLEGLAEQGVREIRGKDFKVLQHHGLFRDDCQYSDGYVIAPDGSRVPANMANPHSRRVMATQCLGTCLRNGQILHGGFYLGSQDFYQRLRGLPEILRQKINMTGVDKINQLDMNPRLYRAQRIHARFINTGLKVTLNGAVVSDTLQSGQVLSGVGGQYNFVAMAHQLQTGRSVIMLRAVRESNGHAESNIVWEYGACTIPRHLRDVVVTEYGIADLRGKSDGEVIKALLNVADSRFQQNLLATAIRAGKIEPDYHIPEQFSENTPQRVKQTLQDLRHDGCFPAYPFGCDFTPEELAVAKALKTVGKSKIQLCLDALTPVGKSVPAVWQWLRVLRLSAPKSLRDRVMRNVLGAALRRALKSDKREE